MRRKPYKKKDPYRFIVKFIPWALATALVAYIAFLNLLPFGAASTYKISDSTITPLAPLERVEVTQANTTEITGSPVYFKHPLPYIADTATITFKYKSSKEYQPISIGYRDRNHWHYNETPLTAPFAGKEEWAVTDTSHKPYLYQKNTVYSNTESFIRKPPADKVVGVFDYSREDFGTITKLPEYTSTNASTNIQPYFRGSVTMYAYLDRELFTMEIAKQDLNWYEGVDDMTIKVSKDNQVVYETIIEDDKNTTSDKVTGLEQRVTIDNPSPDFPESGLYKISIETNDDTVITNIKTNLHKVVFDGPVYVAANTAIYPSLIKQTKPTRLFTKSKYITARTQHLLTQNVIVNSQNLSLLLPDKVYVKQLPKDETDITIDGSDAIIKGTGVFAISKDNYFNPYTVHITAIETEEDLEHIDYILTNYTAHEHRSSEWTTVSREIELVSPVSGKKGLDWALQIKGHRPGIDHVFVDDISVDLFKARWLN